MGSVVDGGLEETRQKEDVDDRQHHVPGFSVSKLLACRAITKEVVALDGNLIYSQERLDLTDQE